MSMFGLGGGGGHAAQGGLSPQMEMAVAEIDMLTDTYNKLRSSCFNKCISPRYMEPDLNKGEGVCIDRCVAKFFAVNKKVGELMQSQQGGAAAQAQGGMGGFGL